MRREIVIDTRQFRTAWTIRQDLDTAEYLAGMFLTLWPGEQVLAWSKP